MDITHAQAKQIVRAAQVSLNTLLFTGPPGVGKTQLPLDITIEQGIGWHERRGSQLEAHHFEGIHVPEHERKVTIAYSCADWPTERNIALGIFPARGILVIDELGTSPAHVAPLLLGLLNERRVKGENISDGWLIVATSNRLIDKNAGVRVMLSTEINRMANYTLNCPIDSWVNWGCDNKIRPDILAYFIRNPAHLNESMMLVADPQNFGQEKPKLIPPNTQFTTPRSASELAREIDAWWAVGNGNPPVQTYEAFLGPIIGPDCYAQCNLAPDSPAYDEVATSPTTAMLPQTSGGMYRTLYMLAMSGKKKDIKAILKYAARIEGSGVSASGEFISCFWSFQREDGKYKSELTETMEYAEHKARK